MKLDIKSQNGRWGLSLLSNVDGVNLWANAQVSYLPTTVGMTCAVIDQGNYIVALIDEECSTSKYAPGVQCTSISLQGGSYISLVQGSAGDIFNVFGYGRRSSRYLRLAADGLQPVSAVDVAMMSTSTPETVVVTRHPALVEYLVETGVIAEGTPVIVQASADDVRDKRVIGVLPLHLAAEAAEVTEVPLALVLEDRGKELSLERLREIAGKPVTYRVSRL